MQQRLAAAAAEGQREVGALAQQLAAAEARCQRLEGEVGGLRGRLAAAEQRSGLLEGQLAEAQQRGGVLEGEVRSLVQRVEEGARELQRRVEAAGAEAAVKLKEAEVGGFVVWCGMYVCIRPLSTTRRKPHHQKQYHIYRTAPPARSPRRRPRGRRPWARRRR